MTHETSSDITEILRTDLRVLLFWADVGIGLSRGGHRQGEIEGIVGSYSDYLCMGLRPRFGRLLSAAKPARKERKK